MCACIQENKKIYASTTLNQSILNSSWSSEQLLKINRPVFSESQSKLCAERDIFVDQLAHMLEWKANDYLFFLQYFEICE